MVQKPASRPKHKQAAAPSGSSLQGALASALPFQARLLAATPVVVAKHTRAEPSFHCLWPLFVIPVELSLEREWPCLERRVHQRRGWRSAFLRRPPPNWGVSQLLNKGYLIEVYSLGSIFGVPYSRKPWLLGFKVQGLSAGLESGFKHFGVHRGCIGVHRSQEMLSKFMLRDDL